MSSIRRFHAYRADLGESIGAHALASHGDQHALLTNSDVVAQLDGPRTERFWLGHARKREHLGTIGNPKGHDPCSMPCRISAGILQHHLVDGGPLDHRKRGRRLNLFGSEQRDRIIAADQSQQRPERGRLRIDRGGEGRNGRWIPTSPLVFLCETFLELVSARQITASSGCGSLGITSSLRYGMVHRHGWDSLVQLAATHRVAAPAYGSRTYP